MTDDIKTNTSFFPPIPHGRLLYCWQRDRQWCIQDHLASAGQGQGQNVISFNTGEGFLWQAGRFSWAAGKSPSSEPCPQLQNLLLWPAFAVTCSGWGNGGYLLPSVLLLPIFLSFLLDFVFESFTFILQWYPLFKFLFLRDAAILYVHATKLWQEIGVYRKSPKILLVLHEKINKTQNFFSKWGMRATNSCKSVWF